MRRVGPRMWDFHGFPWSCHMNREVKSSQTTACWISVCQIHPVQPRGSSLVVATCKISFPPGGSVPRPQCTHWHLWLYGDIWWAYGERIPPPSPSAMLQKLSPAPDTSGWDRLKVQAKRESSPLPVVFRCRNTGPLTSLQALRNDTWVGSKARNFPPKKTQDKVKEDQSIQ